VDNKFVKEIDNILKEKSLLNHPFYKMWSAGKLSMDALKGYAVEYYTLETEFPKLLLQARDHGISAEDEKVLMENYNEETASGNTHADMWLDFAEGLGLNRVEVKTEKPLRSTKSSLNKITSLVKQGYLSGIGALLAYEANLQETSATKIEGLKKYYGLKDRKSTRFFAVHGILDIKHSDDWRIILANSAKTKKQQDDVKKAVGESMDALWSFLDGINDKYNAGVAC
jgi:pyrroloquinoline-quinone synthase